MARLCVKVLCMTDVCEKVACVRKSCREKRGGEEETECTRMHTRKIRSDLHEDIRKTKSKTQTNPKQYARKSARRRLDKNVFTTKPFLSLRVRRTRCNHSTVCLLSRCCRLLRGYAN